MKHFPVHLARFCGLSLAIAVGVTACDNDPAPRQSPDAPPPAADVEPAPRAVANPATPNQAPDGDRSSVYGQLANCNVTRSQPDEAGYRVSECAAPAGFALRLVEADGRHNLFVRKPGGEFVSLRLPEQRGGAFSEIASRVEWRGSGDGDAFVPDVLVLRYLAWEDPHDPKKQTAYLVPVALGADAPCVAGFIAPGPGQTAEARRVADSAPGCLRR